MGGTTQIRSLSKAKPDDPNSGYVSERKGQNMYFIIQSFATKSRKIASIVVALTRGPLLIRNSQEYSDFLRFSRGRRSQGVEVFEETGPRKTGGAKVPFDNFDPENYFGDAGLRNAAARGANPVTGEQGVKNALRGDFDLRLERRHSTRPGSFSEPASGHCLGDPLLLELSLIQ